jgi:CDP-paratose 2-epimerase
MTKTILVTGSSGLIGSQVVEHYLAKGWLVVGIDNDMRKEFFGASTLSRGEELAENPDFYNVNADIRNEKVINNLFEIWEPDAVVHCAAQPSHDLAASIPFVDFEINARGTLNLLEATRALHERGKKITFVHLSTNKVYGDNPNNLHVFEYDTRYDLVKDVYPTLGNQGGMMQAEIGETMSIDKCTHSLFGCSKLYADVAVQEYGKNFGIPTVCLRGGCLTGPSHRGAEAHGFLNYLIRCCATGKPYKVYGYKGKQVRDNIHAYDVAKFIEAFIEQPRVGEVYNIGGGRSNSISILEAIKLAEEITGKKMNWSYVDEPRKGDHICYISDLTKIKSHYPQWTVTKDLKTIFTEIANV